MGETRDADRPTNPRSPFLGGLTATIIVDQERLGANPRSTLGTTTDANAQFRILFSRLGKPHVCRMAQASYVSGPEERDGPSLIPPARDPGLTPLLAPGRTHMTPKNFTAKNTPWGMDRI